MSVILQQEPNDELLAATLDSNALYYIVDISINTGSPTRPDKDPVLQVAYEVNGSIINTEYYNDSTYSYAGGNIHVYRFDFDAQENIQAYFDETNDIFLDQNRGLHQTASQSIYHANFRLILDEWLVNVDGLLELNGGGTQTTNYRNAINAVIHHLDTQDLNDFDNQVLVADANWLTEKPQAARAVCRNADEQLTGWAMGLLGDITGITFNGFNAAGSVISIGSINSLTSLQDGLTVFPVGPQNIINTVGWAITPPILPNDPVMKYYQIKVSAANKSVAFKYYLLDGCCPKHRLYFKNRLGAYDSFDIPDVDIENYIVSSSKFERNRGLEYSQIARGKNKVLSVGTSEWNMIRIRLNEEVAQWAKQLLLSPSVYLVVQEGTTVGYKVLPVLVKDGTFKIVDNTEKPVEFTFTIESALSDRSQRN